MTRIKQLFHQVIARVFKCGRLARAKFLKKFNQRGFGDAQPAVEVVDRFFLKRGLDEVMLGMGIHIPEKLHNFFIAACFQRRIRHAVVHRCQRAQKYRNRHCALAVKLKEDAVVFAGLKLHPGAAVRNQFGGCQFARGGPVYLCFKINTRRSDKLRNHNAFRAVDDERPFRGHFRKIAQENVLLDLIADIVGFQQYRHIQRAGVSQVAFKALFDCILRRIKPKLETKLPGDGGFAREMQAKVIRV